MNLWAILTDHSGNDCLCWFSNAKSGTSKIWKPVLTVHVTYASEKVSLIITTPLDSGSKLCLDHIFLIEQYGFFDKKEKEQ